MSTTPLHYLSTYKSRTKEGGIEYTFVDNFSETEFSLYFADPQEMADFFECLAGEAEEELNK